MTYLYELSMTCGRAGASTRRQLTSGVQFGTCLQYWPVLQIIRIRVDLLRNPETQKFLTPAMWYAVEQKHLNWYCDIYGRMSWDRPAPTIKRESAHPGNGRYLHPEQDRMCTLREAAILQGFPMSYKFPARSRKNRYRHIGDAVPPLISYQLSRLAEWILTGVRPDVSDLVLADTHLRESDIVYDGQIIIDLGMHT